MSRRLPKKGDGFRSDRGFVMACVGSAVGLANIWRFPYLMARYGGLTFLLPYGVCVLLLGLSGVTGELALGRWGGAGPVGCFGRAFEARGLRRGPGEALGVLPILGALGMAVGYAVVMGWVFQYAKLALTGELYALGGDPVRLTALFDALAPRTEALGQGVALMLENHLFGVGCGIWIIIGVVASIAVTSMGIANGVEKLCKLLIPLLFVLFLLLAVYVATLPGAAEGYRRLLAWDSGTLAGTEVWRVALGQAFFSLSVAGSGSVVYGAYLEPGVDLPRVAWTVTGFDTLFALLSTLVVVPAMAATGRELTQVGPELLFVALPAVFHAMGAPGRVAALLFFGGVLFAGLSSILNLFEVPVSLLQKRVRMERAQAVLTVHTAALAAALLIQPWTVSWMDLVSLWLCPFGAALAGAVFFWVLPRETALAAVSAGRKRPVGEWFYALGRRVYVPLCLLALLLGAAGLGG